MKALVLDRRTFLSSAGAAWFMGLTSGTAEAAITSDTIIAAAFEDGPENHGIALLNEQGALIDRFTLPARGHGFASAGSNGWNVVFARRPGTFALAFDTALRRAPKLFHSAEGRHFYSHGLFSADGRILYATENAFETGGGVIGLYDATNGFARIGEISTGGIDPHDMVLMPDGKTLCVANGGILTHPDSGREKLNLATMKSSIAFIDLTAATVSSIQILPPALQRLSLRHIALDRKGSAWVGGQFEGAQTEKPPLIAQISLDQPLEVIELENAMTSALANYVGSVATNNTGSQIAFTSPKGGAALIMDAASKRIVEMRTLPKVCAAAAKNAGFIFATETGRFGPAMHKLAWDNHAALL